MWTPEIDQRISDVVIEHLSHGKTQMQAFRMLRRELNKSQQSIENRWFMHIKPLKEAEIKTAKIAAATRPPLIGPNPITPPWKTTWLKAVDDLIAREIIEQVASGKTQTQAIALLSKKLPFTATEINTRWQQVIKPHYGKPLSKARLNAQILNLKDKIEAHNEKGQQLQAQLKTLIEQQNDISKGDKPS